jgi:hypothetical protein
MYVCTYGCMYVRTCVCVYACMHVCMYYVCVCMYVQAVPTYVHTYCVKDTNKKNGVTSFVSPLSHVVRQFLRAGYIRFQ